MTSSWALGQSSGSIDAILSDGHDYIDRYQLNPQQNPQNVNTTNTSLGALYIDYGSNTTLIFKRQVFEEQKFQNTDSKRCDNNS